MPRKKTVTNPDILEQSTMDKGTVLSSLNALVTDVFMDAQKPEGILRADAIKLRDIQIACCLNSPRMIGEPENIDLDGESKFLQVVFKMVNIVIKAKRKEPTADRVQRFLAGFLQYIQSKDEEAKAKAKEKREACQKNTINDAEEDQTTTDQTNNQTDEVEDPSGKEEPNSTQQSSDEDDMEQDQAQANNDNTNNDKLEEDEEEGEYETVTSRFVESLLRHLFQGFADAKVNVRIRCCQIIALSISSMGELDEDLYQDLKQHLFAGHIDKEASVRSQAVTALCRLQSDTELNPSDGKTILDKLMWSVRHDPSPEVRRLILFNIDVTPITIPFIVQSIRDTDDINRRVVYLKPLSDLNDFRLLSFNSRKQILKWGLNDRNELVKKSAMKMFSEKWIQHAGNNLIEFLERLEATQPDVSELVEQLLKLFFKDRMDIVNEITFDDEFWTNLSGESALLAKVVIEFLQNNGDLDERLDAILPEVTRHVFNLENYYNLSVANTNTDTATSMNYEFIITQLLDISLCLDYADEVGRRKMFEFLRHILRSYELIDDHLERILKVFKTISIDERDFTRSIIEIISDIQEESSNPFGDMDDIPTKRLRLNDSAEQSDDNIQRTDANSEHVENSGQRTEEESQQTPETTESHSNRDLDNMVLQLRCLNICKRMLENSYEPLTENSILYGLLNDLIAPAVQNADALVRQEGLHCLGLCCTLDKRLAQHNIILLITCIKQGHEDLVMKSVRTLGDVLLMYGVEAMCEHLSGPDDIREVFEFGLDHDNAEIQSLTTQALCKLMLFNRFNNDELLRLMVLLYFFPKTIHDNTSNSIHQCLAYFFPAYCYSSADHQKSISNITLPALEELCNIYDDLDKDETMTNPRQIAEMLADWNDPRKLAKTRTALPDYFVGNDKEGEAFATPGTLAIQALTITYNEEDGLRKKTIIHFMIKLYWEKAEKTQLAEIRKLIRAIDKHKPIKLMPTRKAMNRIADTIDTIIGPFRESDDEEVGNKEEEHDENASEQAEKTSREQTVDDDQEA